MQHFATSIDSDFARLHGLTPELLVSFLDILPCLASHSTHSADPAFPRSSAVQNCYRLRLDAAEQRYARMAGLVSASLEAQHRLRVDNECLRAVQCIKRSGLEQDCAMVLDAVGSGGVRLGAVAAEIQALTARLNAALEENEQLMSFNRVLRGEQALPVCRPDPPPESVSQQIDALTIESQTQRAKISALELACTRFQSDVRLFDQEERLRECEDVFDQILGRPQPDHSAGTSLKAYHPIGTCKNTACIAYARRLRGGLHKAVTAAYVNERIERMNGLVQGGLVPLETLRVEKDNVIRSLRLRICQFEQSLRMTSEEADRIELRAVSSEILRAATELEGMRIDCGKARTEFLEWRQQVGVMEWRQRALVESIDASKCELQVLAEEKTVLSNCCTALNEERALMSVRRQEAARFNDGRMGATLKEQRTQLEAVQREMEGMRMERVDFEEQRSAMEQDPPVVCSVESQNKKARHGSSSLGFDVSPTCGVRTLCQCGERVPLTDVFKHASEKHAARGDLVVTCGAGCGFFVVNGNQSDVDQHMRSKTCGMRMLEIQKLAAGFGSV